MSELEAQIQNRKAKRNELSSAGVDTYPARVDYDLEPTKVHERYDERSAEELEAGENRLRCPGSDSRYPSPREDLFCRHSRRLLKAPGHGAPLEAR